MSRPTRLLLLVLSVWPIVYVIGFLALVAVEFSGGDGASTASKLVPVHIGTMLLILGLTAFYALHALRRGPSDRTEKGVWAVALLVGNVLVFPVYWYLYLWRPASPGRADGLLTTF